MCLECSESRPPGGFCVACGATAPEGPSMAASARETRASCPFSLGGPPPASVRPPSRRLVARGALALSGASRACRRSSAVVPGNGQQPPAGLLPLICSNGLRGAMLEAAFLCWLRRHTPARSRSEPTLSKTFCCQKATDAPPCVAMLLVDRIPGGDEHCHPGRAGQLQRAVGREVDRHDDRRIHAGARYPRHDSGHRSGPLYLARRGLRCL